MTAADAKTFNDMFDNWCVQIAGGRCVETEKKRVGIRDGYTACGGFWLLHRKYELASPFGVLSLSVFGMTVFAKCSRQTVKPERWLFRGMTAADAYAAMLNKLRRFLEPTGELQ